MRLYPDEKEALDNVLADVAGEAYLFGSRVDDNKKGGDIDILIFSTANPLQLAQDISIKFMLQLDSSLDVLVLDKNNMTLEQQAFVNTLDMVRIN